MCTIFSLCTTLCLQWEPEIIAASLMYLGTKLNKFEITDWSGKVAGTKQHWYESIVPDLTIELMEGNYLLYISLFY